jgi:hypothetical protein
MVHGVGELLELCRESAGPGPDRSNP